MKRVAWILVGIGCLAALGWALRPPPVLVETARVTRGDIRSTIGGDARTRVKTLYTLTSPVDGELERIVFEPGAALPKDAVVARIRPAAPRPLDARSRAEAAAAVVAAREGVSRAEAAEREAEVGAEHANSKLARTTQLAQSGAVPAADLEHGGHEAQIARRSLESAQALVRQARADLARALAVVGPSPGSRAEAVVEVRTPAAGKVLRVLRESAGPVAAGTPLAEIGDVRALEIVADLLSSDAASVREGAAAAVTGWGTGPALSAKVRRIEPAGFTKVSALGLEEQRARVILELDASPPEALGHDYRVDVAIVAWEGHDVLRVPSTALFRDKDRWSAFVIRDGRAHRVTLDTGASDASFTLARTGLAEGDQVIPQPSDSLADGMRVEALR
jgi:HlyD family secretion protein